MRIPGATSNSAKATAAEECLHELQLALSAIGCPITHLSGGNNRDHARGAISEALEKNDGELAIVLGNCPKMKKCLGSCSSTMCSCKTAVLPRETWGFG